MSSSNQPKQIELPDNNIDVIKRQAMIESVRALSEAVLKDTIVILLDSFGQVVFIGDKPWQGESMIRNLQAGDDFRIVFPPENATYADHLFERVLLEGQVEVELIDREALIGRLVKLTVINNDYVLVSVRNIDDAVATNARYEKAELELASLQNQIHDMSEGAHETHHDVRGPLASLLMTVELLEMAGNIEQKRLERLKTAVQDILELFTYFINTIDAQRDVLEHKLATVETASIIQEVTQIEAGRLHIDGTSRVQIIIPKELENIRVFVTCFRLLMSNLISNALKYSSDTVIVEFSAENDEIVLKIIDTGIGIPEAEIINMYKKSFRASNTRGIDGTGHGSMNIAKYTRWLNGAVSIQSIENEGTTVTVRLPFHEVEA